MPRPPETNQGNLFVRLSPRTIHQLHESAVKSQNEELDVFILDSSVVIEFLPLEIIFQAKDEPRGTITVYGSYNGGSPASAPLASGPYRTGKINM